MLDFIRFGVKLNGEQYDIILAKGAFLSNDSSLYISFRIDDFASYTIYLFWIKKGTIRQDDADKSNTFGGG